MELRHLRYFVAVAEEQNITRAAARLYVSQPPLSRQIRDLEREIGIPLFHRTRTAIKLTEVGRIFLLEARQILQRTNEAIELVRAAAGGKRGRVRVGYAASATAEMLPRVLRNLHASSPGIAVHLKDMSTQSMLRGLREGGLDVALIVPLADKADFFGLILDLLGHYKTRIAVHPKHRFAKYPRVSIGEIAKEPLIAFTRHEYPEYHAYLSEVFRSQEKAPIIAEEFDSAVSLIAAVGAGRGVALVFETLAFMAGNRLCLRPITPEPRRVPLGIAYRKDELSAATSAFIKAAQAAEIPSK